MPLSLTIEDGSIVADADSYVSVGDFITFAAKRGSTVVDGDPAVIALTQAMDLIADYSDRFVGQRISAAQALDWPRRAYVDGNAPGCPVPINMALTGPWQMPPTLITAQCFAALAAYEGTTLQPVVGTEGFVSSEKIGPLQTDYQKGSDYSSSPRIPAFERAIDGLCEPRPFLLNWRA